MRQFCSIENINIVPTYFLNIIYHYYLNSASKNLA